MWITVIWGEDGGHEVEAAAIYNPFQSFAEVEIGKMEQ